MLLAGATLVLSPQIREEIDVVARKERITILNIPTAVWHEWVGLLTDGRPPPPQLRLVVIGGDAALTEPLQKWQMRVGKEVVLRNSYGPTEATVTTASYSPPKGALPVGSSVPIGRSYAGALLRVLDGNLRSVPTGVPGELYIGGAPLARGYLNRPELTAERFVPDPFGRSGSRLYKTGDRVRTLRSGELEFLGRTDFQVKIRGFRIELGEIEAALLAQPSVREALVLVREDVPGDKRLVAYVVAKEGTEILVEEVRASLKKSLPQYMIPAAFVTLAALPLTPSGKLDRRALPAPEWGGDPETYVAPRTPAEEVLAGIWAQVLKVARVGADDNFFLLGGDSLMVIRVSVAAGRQGLRITPAMLFQSQTVLSWRGRWMRALWRTQSSGWWPGRCRCRQCNGGSWIRREFHITTPISRRCG